jgi:oxygen-dependent protoporphyrinogen oxidase
VPSSGGAFFKSKLLSLGGKLRIFREPFIPVRKSDEEESVASFARRRIGREAAERMVAPFVSGIYAGDAERLSVQAAFPRLSNLETSYGGLFRGTFAKAREARKAKKAARDVLDKAAPTRRRLISFNDGMSVLPQTIASRLGEDVYTDCKDIRARAGVEGNGFEVEFDRAGAGGRFLCRQLVIATPARPAAMLVRAFSDELSRLLDEIYYPPLSIVCLSYDVAAVRTPLDGFGFLVAPGEALNILGCVWNSSLFKGRAPAGKALLTVFIGGARMPDLARLGDAELVSAAHSDLQKILGISQEAQPVSITRWERAIPQYLIGHRDRVRRIEEILKSNGGLRLIGNYLHGVSTGDCVKEADRHAREIWDSLSLRP